MWWGMKVHIGPRDKFPLMNEINMIPLIDVALVLLIIFMVVTPFLVTSQIKVNLPKAVSGANAEAEPVTIQITSKKTVYINNEATLMEDIAGTLRSAFTKKN